MHKERKQNCSCQGLRKGETREFVVNRYRDSSGEDEKVQEMDGGDGGKIR